MTPPDPAPPYLRLAEAAELARVSSKRLRNLMTQRVLVEGVHYTRPRGLRPRFIRAALITWLEGHDAPALADEGIPMARHRRRLSVDLDNGARY